MKRQGKSKNATDSNRPDAPKLALDSAEYRDEPVKIPVPRQLLGRLIADSLRECSAEEFDAASKMFTPMDALFEDGQLVRFNDRKTLAFGFVRQYFRTGGRYWVSTVDRYDRSTWLDTLWKREPEKFDAREIVGNPFKSPLVSPTEERQ